MFRSRRASLFSTVGAVIGVLALTGPALAYGAPMPAGPTFDPLPPPPISPEEIEQAAAKLSMELVERGGEDGDDPQMQTFMLPETQPGLVPPDPTDFEAITQDPDTYGIPASADRYATADGYTIPRPTAGGEGAGTVPVGLEEFYHQELSWEGCEDFMGDDALECTYVIAPLDYSDPDGSTIALAISRAPALSGEAKGSVLVNPGGPGSPGIDLAGAGFFAELNEDFNIVGFDPRGVGASLPMIRCQSNEAWDWQRQGSDELTSEEINAVLQYNTEACYDNTGGIFGVDDLIDHVGTVNVVKDLDIIRAALGDPKINYLGFSYGTSIGYEFSRQFPDNIRALVIDGVVDVLENNPEEKAKYAEFQVPSTGNGTITQIAGFQATFEQFLSWCAAQGEECALVDEEGDNDVEDLLSRYQQIARLAWGGQTYETEDGRPLSFEDFNQGTIMAMYSDSLWPALNAGLAEIQADPTTDFFMMALSDLYAGREGDGTYSLDLAAFPTIWCNDAGPEPGFNDDIEGQIQFIKDYYAAAPFTDPRTEDDPDRGMEPSNDWCTYYQENFTLPTAQTLEAMPNILAISTTYDSATPFDQGVVAAAALGGTLLIAAGNSHTSYGAAECVTETTNEYFRTLRVPTDIPGAEGVSTKDVHSQVVTGNECAVTDQFRPVTALGSGEGEQGARVLLPVEGLVRNSEYAVAWKYGSLALTSTEDGTGEVEVVIPEGAEIGAHKLVLSPGLDGENDPTIRAEATLRVLEAEEPVPTPTDSGPTETPEPTDPGPSTGDDGDGDIEGEDDDKAPATVPGGQLDETGVNVKTIALIAAIVIIVGGVVVLLARRRSAP